MIVHTLKAWPTYFRPTWDGEKLFDVRYDDRGFQRGDLVNLREWDNGASCKCKLPGHADTCERYTGRRIVAEVGYVLGSTPGRGSRPGFAGAGYVVLSLMNLDRVAGARLSDLEASTYTSSMSGMTVQSAAEGARRIAAAGFSARAFGVVPAQRQPDQPESVIPCSSPAGHKLAADNRTCIRCHGEFDQLPPQPSP